jgi:uncharacterized phage-associated protein
MRERLSKRVQFEFNADKAVAVIAYLASRPPEDLTVLDKYKVGKLLFLADKYHLVRYGRPILGDEYRALEWGPVPQRALDMLHALLDKSKHPRDPQHVSRLLKTLKIDRTLENPRFRAKAPGDLSCLSRSEIMALDRIVSIHGRKSFPELLNLTHAMPAYRKPWSARTAGAKMAPMRYEDFFEEDADAIKGAFEEMIEDDALRKSFPPRL